MSDYLKTLQELKDKYGTRESDDDKDETKSSAQSVLDGIKGNASGGDTGRKESSSFAQSVLDRIKSGLSTSVIDHNYINSFISEGNSFFSDAERRYNSLGWSNASDTYSTVSSKWRELEIKANRIGSWLNQNKNNLDAETYTSLSDTLTSFRKNGVDIVKSFEQNKDFYAQFETEGAYDKWYAGYKVEEDAKVALNTEDFAKYSQLGTTVGNPTWDEAQAPWIIFGWKPFGEGKPINNWVSFAEEHANSINMMELGQGQMEDDEREMAHRVIGISRHMTDEEKAIYNYYIGKGETEKANEYLEYMLDVFKQREAGEIRAKYDGTAAELLYSGAAGFEQFALGVKNVGNMITGEEGEDKTILQYVHSGMSSNNEGIWKVSNDLINTLGNMAPSMAVGSLTGGLGGALTLGVSASGNAYADMRELGYRHDQATAYGVMVGASETLISYGLSGISKLGGKVSGNVVANAIAGIDNAIARVAIEVGGSMASEALEEAVQEMLDPVFKMLATGEDFEGINWENVAYSALLGALSGGLLEGAPTVVSHLSGAAKATKFDPTGVREYITEALAVNPENAHAQRMQARLDQGKRVSQYQVDRLVQDTETTMREQDKAKIKGIVEARLTELGAKGNVGKIADKIVKALEGVETGGKSAKSALNSFKKGSVERSILEDVLSETPGEWTRQISTNRIMSDVFEEVDLTETTPTTPDVLARRSSNVALEDILPIPDVSTSSGTSTPLANTPVSTPTVDNAVSEAASNSDDGKVTMEKDGEEVEVKISRIASIDNGEISFELEGGEVVKNEDLDYGEGLGLVYQSAADMSTRLRGFNLDVANLFIGGYEPKGNISASDYVEGWNASYRFGALGLPEAELKKGKFTSKLTEEQRTRAYNLGKIYGNEKAAERQTKVDNIPKGTEKRKGKLRINESIDKKKITERQQASIEALEVIADKLGVNIEIFESPVENGQRKGFNGKYDPRTNTIYIDLYAGVKGESLMLFTASHELTHFIRDWSPAKFKVFADFLLAEYNKSGMSVEKLIQVRIESLKKHERIDPSMTEEQIYDLAYEEVIADACEAMLTDSNALKVIAKLKSKDKSLWERIKDYIVNLVKKIKEAYKGLNPDSIEGNLTRQMLDSAERLQQLWTEALVDAGKRSSSAATHTSGETGTRYSYSSISYSFFGDDSVSIEDFESGRYRETEGYRRYVDQCLSNMRQTATGRFNEAEATKEIKDSIDGIVRVAVAMKKAGYDIFDNGAKRGTRDSKGRLLFSSLEPNSDYLTSSDISTICDKRLNFAEIYDEIVRREEALGVPKGKRFFDNVDNYFILHKIMADKGLTQPCRQCYVESMRKNLAPMANAFLRLMQETDPNNKANDQLFHPKGKGKGTPKTNNAKLRENLLAAIAEAEYDITVDKLTVEMLTTEDGLAQLKLQAPLIYEAFNSFYGQSKPKMPKSATPFRFGELTALLTDHKGKIKKSLVDQIMSTGGFRLQSYSDFQIQNFADVLQVIFEAGTLGLSGHAYTKVPAFLDATKGTNLKRNISIFMYNDNGQWRIDRNDSFPYDLDAIYDIVKNDESGNTSIIAVSQNEMMAAWVMANDNVGYFIPFHKSGMKMGTVRETIVREGGREIKGYSGIKDHTRQQTEVWAFANAEHKANTKVKRAINIYEFWDFENADNLSREELIKKNLMAYIDACYEAGYLPKFREYVMNNSKVLNSILEYSKQLGFVSQDATIDDISFEYKGYRIPYGYYKCLGDFGMFNAKGEASPIERLSLKDYNFDEAEAFFSNAETLRRNEILQQIANGEERERYRNSDMTTAEIAEEVQAKRNTVVEEVVSGEYKRMRYSDRDSTGSTLSPEQQEFFRDSVVRDSKGNLMVLYHGTTASFNTFKRGDVGFHFGTKGAARGRVGFGKSVTLKEVYLNITNPIVFDEDLGSWDADYRLTRELYEKGILTQEEAEAVLFTDDKRYRRTTEAANKKLSSVLLEKGYDGISYPNTFETKKPTTSYIVFNSNQAKEITNKKPTSNPDIRYSERDSYQEGLSETDKELADQVISRLRQRVLRSRYGITPSGTYTAERIDHEISYSSSDVTPDYANSYITWVSPSDFVYATTGSGRVRETLREEAGELDVERLSQERQPIYLLVDFETGQIVGHEGRHRMLALQKAGIEKVAVIIEARNNDLYHTKPVEIMSLKGQRFTEFQTGVDFYLHDMLPLSRRYADVARELFSHESKGGVRFSERDNSYMEAVTNGDMETAQRMVEEAAREAGYTSGMLYHGSDAFGFTVIDNEAPGADGYSFWAADRETTSATYTNYGRVRQVSSAVTDEHYDAAREALDTDIDAEIDNFRHLIDRTFSEWYFGQSDNQRLREAFDSANATIGHGDGVYDVFEEYVADAYYQYKDDLDEAYSEFYEWVDESEEGQKLIRSVLALEGLRRKQHKMDTQPLGGIYQLYANTDNMYEMNGRGANWDNLNPEGLPQLGRPYKTRDVAEWAKNNGYDGVIFREIVDGGKYGEVEASDVYAFFRPQAQVKSADPVTYDSNGEVIPLSERFNPENSDIRYSDRESQKPSYAPTFYSHMGKVIDGIKIEKMGAGGVVSYLKGKGVKDEEIKWSGIEAFLEGKKSVTKAELQEFVAGSQLQIEEEMAVDEQNADIVLHQTPQPDVKVLYIDGKKEDIFRRNEYGNWVSDEFGDVFFDEQEILDQVKSDYARNIANTRWSQYKLDGGENYRELVFKLSDSTYSNKAMRGHWGQDAEGVLAHARIQDMTTSDGRRMLFVEEIQSDWHNEGRQEGYTTEEYEDALATYNKLAEEYAKANRAFNKYVRSSEFNHDPEDVRKKKFDWLRGKVDTAEKRMKIAEQTVEALKKKGMGDVPDAPFRSTYHEYVLKRLLRMAAEEGYDSIGWTPAQIQSERWSEVYAEGYRIEYDQDIPKFLRKYGKRWGATVDTTLLGGDDIDALGRAELEAQARMLDAEEALAIARLRGDQAEIERLNTEYLAAKSQYSKAMKKSAEASEGTKVWSMDIPDSMKDSVLYEGQVLYSDRVTDSATLEFLENQEHVTVYRAMQVIDGELYPPMAARVKGEDGKKALVTPSRIGEWEQAVERPDLIRGGNKFELDKANGSSIAAAYNPYFHTSASPLNDQFSSAYKRPNLVIVEGVIPSSELTSGYRAEFAKDTVGETKWHSGPVASKLKGDKARRVFLSRWFKPVRIVPDSEVASIVAKTLEGENIEVPYNVVTPSLRTELENVGVPIRYSERDTDGLSNRSLLLGALEGTAQNEVEAKRLAEYKEKIDLINAEETKLKEIRAKIKELSFAKGRKDTKALRDLQFEAKQTENRINTYDRQLLELESTKALRGVLEREKANARKRAERKGKEALERYRERVAETQRELIRRYQESRKKGVEGRHRTAMRHKIKDIVHELNQYLLNGTKERHVPIELQKPVAEALDAVNMDTVGAAERIARLQAELMSAKTPEAIQEIAKKIERIQKDGGSMEAKLSRLKTAYDSIINSDDPLVANAHDEVISNTIAHVMETVGSTPLRDMTLGQLEAVYDMYRMVLHSIRTANKAFKAKKSEEISVIANRVLEEIDKLGKRRSLRTDFGEAISTFDWNNTKPVYAFERIGSDTFSEIFSSVREGEDTWAVDMSEAQAFREEQYNKYKYNSWDFKKRFKFTSTSGQTFELTLDQIMSLYAYSKREQAGDHLKYGGFVFDGLTEVKKKGKLGVERTYKLKDSTAYNLSEETVAEIIGKLSTEQKTFVDVMQDYLSTTMGEKGNEVSLELYGIKLFKEKHYFPLRSAPQYLERAREQAQQTVRIKNGGFTKETTPKARNPIVLTSFMDVWAGHVQDMSMYHAFTLPLEDFYRVFNYKTPVSETIAQESVIQYLENTHGEASVSYIDQLLKDLNGGARSDSRETIVKALMSKFKKASVMASLSVVIQQPTAIVRAMALVDAKYFGVAPITRGVLRTFNRKKHKSLWSEIKKYAPVAIIKEMGNFDTGMGRGSVEWLKGEKTLMDKIDDITSKPAAVADELAWISIWEAVKRETAKNNPTLETSSEEYLKKAGERFTEVIVKTQVYDSTLAKSSNMRSRSAFMAMLTAFMAEPTTSLNMIQDAIRKGKRGNKKYAAKAFGAVLGSVALNAALVSLVYAMRDDDEDETFTEKYVSRFTTELIDGVNPITYIPFAKDVWSVAQGFDIERADMSLITDLIGTMQKATKTLSKDTSNMSDKELDEHMKDTAEALWGIVDNIASLGGIPAKNIRRDVNGIINLFKTLGRDMDTTYGSLMDTVEADVKASTPIWGWLPNESKGDKLYDAIMSGDTAYVDRLKSGYKDETSYRSALRKALRENDPRIKEAAEARYNGDIAEYMRIAKEIIAEGNFKQDDVVSAINSVINSMQAGETTSSTPSNKVVSLFKIEDYYAALSSGETFTAKKVKEDLIATEVANGKTRADAEASFTTKFVNHIRDLYESGDIYDYEVKRMLTSYGGKTTEEAASKVQYWSFKKQYPNYDLSETAVNRYYDELQSSGISVAVYYDYTKQRANAKGTDSDGDGKTDSGSVKTEVMWIIHSLPISSYQKDALYYFNGWATSTLWEAPWR